MDVLTPHRPPPPDADSPTRSRWRTHLGRFAVALLAVGAVWSVGNRIGSRGEPVPGQGVAEGSTPAVMTMEALEAAARAQPDDPAVFQRLGNEYLDRLIQTLDPRYSRLAERAFDRAEELAPGDNVTALGRAGLASTRHDFTEALDAANVILADNPFSAKALALRVDSDIELGRYEDAEIHLQEFLDRRPGAAALARASYFRELHGDVDGALVAIEDAEVAARSGSINDRAQLAAVRGDVLMGAGRPRDARTAYLEAIALVPELPLAVLGAARADAILGDSASAIRSLESLVEQTPLIGAAILLAELYSVDGDTAGVERARNLVSEFAARERAAGADVDLVLAEFEADFTTVDAATVRRAVATFERTPGIYAADALAWTLYRSGDAEAAIPVVEQALRTGSSDGGLRFHAAVIFEAVGDPDRATQELTRAAESDPWFSISRQDEARSLAARLGVDWPVRPPS